MTFTLPTSLQSEDDDAALRLLTRYFGPVVGDPGSYTGAAWDSWDPSGRREQDIDQFTADDCMAVTLLSVNIPGQAAHTLLVKDRARYSALLAEVGPDRDLVEVAEPITDDWPPPCCTERSASYRMSVAPRPASCWHASARRSSRSGTASSAASPRPVTTSGNRSSSLRRR